MVEPLLPVLLLFLDDLIHVDAKPRVRGTPRQQGLERVLAACCISRARAGSMAPIPRCLNHARVQHADLDVGALGQMRPVLEQKTITCYHTSASHASPL